MTQTAVLNNSQTWLSFLKEPPPGHKFTSIIGFNKLLVGEGD